MNGPLFTFFEDDHRRLDGLLERAAARPGEIDAQSYAAFRAGLLEHIALEEKILLPATRRRRGGEPLAIARRLRIDHGALALLLVPSPTPELVGELRSILDPHNQLEESAGGLYALSDELLADEAAHLLETARVYPDVKVARHHDGERACRTAAEALRISEKQH